MQQLNFIINSHLKDINIKKKKKFCCFLVSNPDCLERNNFFEILNSFKKVDSGGKFKNNIGINISKNFEEQLEWISDYKFMITFENSSKISYITEKPIIALMGNTIPIYWGAPNVNDFLDEKSIINYHKYNNFNLLADKVIEIDENPELYNNVLNNQNINTFKFKKEDLIYKFNKLFD